MYDFVELGGFCKYLLSHEGIDACYWGFRDLILPQNNLLARLTVAATAAAAGWETFESVNDHTPIYDLSR